MANDVGDGDDIGKFTRERSSNGRITELDSRRICLILHLHHAIHHLVRHSRGRIGALLCLICRLVPSLQRPCPRRDNRRDGIRFVLGCQLCGSDALLRSLPFDRLLVVRVGRTRGIQVCDMERRGRRSLVETFRKAHLLLVDFLELGKAIMLCDTAEIILGTVQEGDTNVCLFQRADVVGSIATHESRVAGRFESVENEFLVPG